MLPTHPQLQLIKTLTAVQVLLLVDDDEEDAFFFSRLLGRAQIGSHVHHRDDGEGAIRYLAGEGPFGDRQKFPLPQLAVLDLRMPKVSGYDLLKWSSDHFRQVPFLLVVLTSLMLDADHQRAKDLGAHHVAVKPPSGGLLQKLSDEFGLKWPPVRSKN